MYASNPWNAGFGYFNFGGDERFITKYIYCINDDIIEMLNNGLIVDVYANWM